MTYNTELEEKIKQQMLELEAELNEMRTSMGYEFDTHEINKLIKRLKEIDAVVLGFDLMMGKEIYPYHSFGIKLCKLHDDAQNMLTYFNKLNERCASNDAEIR